MIVLLTDFGTDDLYVGVMKGVIGTLAPGLPVVDLAHGVPPQAIGVGAAWLDAAWRYFPVGATFVCVVDPGVGTTRRPLAVRAGGRTFVGPDNGLLGLLPIDEARVIAADWGLEPRSATFQGRDLFAPVAARLAAGADFAAVGPLAGTIVAAPVPAPALHAGVVLWTDRFGNLVTSLGPRTDGVVSGEGWRAPVVRTSGDAPDGALVALTGSAGRLELSVVGGDAGRRLGLGAGQPVTWAPA